MTSSERIEELLATRATQRLRGEESMELRSLLAEDPQLETEDFELAAAAFYLALESEAASEELPEQLRGKITEQAISIFETSTEAPSGAVASMAAPVQTSSTRPSWLPWMAAAAAGLIAVVGWWPRLTEPELPPPLAEPSVAEVRESLIEASEVLRLDWQATEDPAASGARGDVVWSDAWQQGYMRISGLAANDPSVEQYQLWIFDPDKDDRYPVDGGVFDMPSGVTETIIPIDAKIEVRKPVLFAITVEKPGGVVVSSRERIVLLAQA